jgi:hypothetical protein
MGVNIGGIMTITITTDTSTVTWRHPESIIRTLTSQIDTYNFSDGTETSDHNRKTGDQITMNFLLNHNTLNEDLETLNTIMDDMEQITITGLPDTHMNTQYQIADLSTSKKPGDRDRYRVSLSVNRKYNRLYTG